MIRVRQILRPADRDDQPGAVRLHVAHRVIDRIGIGKRRVHVVLAVDQRHIRVELPIIGLCRIRPLAILAVQDIEPILQLVVFRLDGRIVVRCQFGSV